MDRVDLDHIPKLIDITLDDIAQGLDFGHFNSEHLVKAYQERNREIDHDFKAILELNEDASSIARDLDNERKLSGRRGPLHGVPILLKDNIHTKDNMMTTAGSFALLGAQSKHEAAVATKLRHAGAILLGKTNMSEWANFRSETTSNGWSARGGQCTGPYCPQQDPSGSSSGSGVATALGLALASIGTETDGSITYPAEKSNIVGIKPTVGLVARDGVIPISDIQDTVGPMARTVKDAAEILTVIAGKSAYDERTQQIPFDTIPNYAASCQSTDLTGLRIGVPDSAFTQKGNEIPNVVLAEFEIAIKALLDLGATLIRNANFSSLEEWAKVSPDEKMSVLSADFKSAIETHLQALPVNPHNIHSLADMVAFTQAHPQEEYPSRGIERWQMAESAARLPPAELQRRREQMLRCSKEEGILGALAAGRLDALVCPTAEKPWITFAARAGLPVVTVPMGFYPAGYETRMNKRGDLVDKGPGVPFCVYFLGEAFSEARLIRIAYAFEQRTQVRKRVQPWKVPGVELNDVVRDGG
ncbi:hypothetical protein MMC13_007833 [Lambiella insularis]|nr:hypothetical protein [Lambiella insularis]